MDGADEVEAPNVFRVAVLSELLARPQWSTTATPPRSLVTLGRAGGIDGLFALLSPRLAFDLKDPWTDQTVRVDLALRSLRSFRPAELAEQIPLLRTTLEAVGLVSTNAQRAVHDLERLLPGCNETAAVVRALSPRGRTREGSTGAAPKPAGDDALASFFSLVDDGSNEPSPAVAPTPATSDDPRARLDARLASLLQQVLDFPELRRLESAWRGLAWLLAETPPANVELLIFPHGSDELDAFGTAAERADGPFDLVLVPEAFGNSAADGERLAALADLGETLRAPVVTGATHELLGMPDLDTIARFRGSFVTRGDAGNAVLRNLAARDASRWLTLLLGNVLARGPWDESTARLRNARFAEHTTPPLLSGVLAVGIACARSAVSLGIGADPTEDRVTRIGNLAILLTGTGDNVTATSVDRSFPADVADDLARAGIATLSSAPNRDEVRVERVPVVYRGPELGAGMAAPARASISDQLFVGRLSRALEDVANAIPADTEPSAIREVVLLSLHPLFQASPLRAPELIVSSGDGIVRLLVRPRRFAGTRLEEIELGARLRPS